MDEKNFAEGLAIGHGMKSGWGDDWFILILLAILLDRNGRSETEVTRKEFNDLKVAVEDLRGVVAHDE